MNATTWETSPSGCCGGNSGSSGSTSACGCATQAASVEIERPSVNGIALLAPGQQVGPDELRQRAVAELLRQEAVRLGRLSAMRPPVAPAMGEAEQRAIEALLDEAVTVPEPDEEAMRRYYVANQRHFVVGQALHVRHILFAVTPGVNVHALAQKAEGVLLELCRQGTPEARFAELARQWSNCPSGAEGGELGWIGPDDCAPELANELFFQRDAAWGMGVHPRLVHTRFGLHIVQVLGRRPGRTLAFDEVRERIGLQMRRQAQATALRQYLAVLAGQADLRGVDLEGASSPLVQ